MFSFNSNNLNAQEDSTELYNLKKNGSMYRGLPVLMSIKSIDFGSSESEFEASVSSTILAWASKKSPSGSWVSSYVSSANGVISICNAIVGKSKVLYLSIVFLHEKDYGFTQSNISIHPC